MTSVYFDTSAFSELWKSAAFSERLRLRVRRRLCSVTFERRPTVILGPSLLTEMARIRDSWLVRSELALLRTLPGARFLKATKERIQAEVRLAAGAQDSIFLSTAMQGALLAGATRMPAMWDAEEAFLAAQKKLFVDSENASRKGILEDVGGQAELAKNIKTWFADPDGLTARWARDFMRSNQKELGLGSEERNWPDPRELPTVWGIFAYRVARLFLVNRDARRIDANDFPDWGHYAAAVHADFLVVDDGKFRDVVTQCAPPKPVMLSSTEWLTSILGPGSQSG